MGKRSSRPSTIYDKASLQLHPDGSKVSSNKNTRNFKISVQDAKGNWIANDAFGNPEVKRYRTKRPAGGNDEEDLGDLLRLEDERYGNDDGEQDDPRYISEKKKGKRRADPQADDNEDDGISRNSENKRKATDLESRDIDDPRTPRKRKKRKKSKKKALEADLDFLEGHSNQPLQVHEGLSDSPLFTQLPSTELLNSVHYFASQYYTERGQLTHQSDEWRAFRAATHRAYRARKKLAKAGHPIHQEDQPDPDQNAEQDPGDEEVSGGCEDGDEDVEGQQNSDVDDEEKEDSDSADDHGRKDKRKTKARIKPEDWAERGWRQDMYRMMDGSALMALGMLVQTYVGHLLTPENPPGWDQNWESVEEVGEMEGVEGGIEIDEEGEEDLVGHKDGASVEDIDVGYEDDDLDEEYFDEELPDPATPLHSI